jgi:hypothetical protein
MTIMPGVLEIVGVWTAVHSHFVMEEDNPTRPLLEWFLLPTCSMEGLRVHRAEVWKEQPIIRRITTTNGSAAPRCSIIDSLKSLNKDKWSEVRHTLLKFALVKSFKNYTLNVQTKDQRFDFFLPFSKLRWLGTVVADLSLVPMPLMRVPTDFTVLMNSMSSFQRKLDLCLCWYLRLVLLSLIRWVPGLTWTIEENGQYFWAYNFFVIFITTMPIYTEYIYFIVTYLKVFFYWYILQ